MAASSKKRKPFAVVFRLVMAFCLAVAAPLTAFADYCADPWTIWGDQPAQYYPPQNTQPTRPTVSHDDFTRNYRPGNGSNMSPDTAGAISAQLDDTYCPGGFDYNGFTPARIAIGFGDWMAFAGLPAPMYALFGGLGAVGAWADARTTIVDYLHDPIYGLDDYCADPWAAQGQFAQRNADGTLDNGLTAAQMRSMAGLYALRQGIASGLYTYDDVAYVAAQRGIDISPLRLDSVGKPIVNVDDGLRAARSVTYGKGAVVTTTVSTAWTVGSTTADGHVSTDDGIAIVTSTTGMLFSHANYYNGNYARSWVTKVPTQTEPFTTKDFGLPWSKTDTLYNPSDVITGHRTTDTLTDTQRAFQWAGYSYKLGGTVLEYGWSK